MPEMTVAGALVAGLLGSVHCLGMCGGIAGAAGLAGNPGARLGRTVLYNAGRVASYAIAGALAGGAGVALGDVLDLPAWSTVLRVLAGLVLVALGLNIALQWRLLAAIETAGAGLWRRLAPLAGRLLRSGHPLAMLGLGGLWGWLPCGLVYTVLLAAAASGSAWQGAATMLAFGLGTLPAMLAAGVAAGTLLRLVRSMRVRMAAGLLLVLMGAWTALHPVVKLATGGGAHSQHGAMVPMARAGEAHLPEDR